MVIGPPNDNTYRFFRYNFLPEVDNDVVSGVAVEYVSVDVVPAKLGDSRSNGSWDIRGADFMSNELTYRSLSHKIEMP